MSSVNFQYRIYFMPEPRVGIATALSRCAGKLALAWTPRVCSTSEVPPPDLARRPVEDLTPAQAAALARSTQVLVLELAAPRAEITLALRDSARLAAALARETGGLIWDAATEEAFLERGWRAQRLHDDPRALVLGGIRVRLPTREGDIVRLCTAGMVKLGLPDVAWTGGVKRSMEMLHILRAAAYALWRRGEPGAEAVTLDLDLTDVFEGPYRDALRRRGGDGKGRVRIIPGRRRDGEPDNRIVELDFGGPLGHVPFLTEILKLPDLGPRPRR
jgi:hypothetical protein